MKPLLIGYKKCSTCQKAEEYLKRHHIDYSFRKIKEERVTEEELKAWKEKYNIEIDRLFNTSGMLYRSLNLKEKRPGLSEEEKYRLLASDGMLVKRPLLITEKQMLIGWKEKEWEEYVTKN